MTKFLLSLLPLLTVLSCYSAGGDGDGDGNSGGISASGGSTSGGSTSGGSTARGGSFFGGSSSGGSTARGGSGGEICGPCPGIACLEAVTLQITPDPSVAPANLSKIVVEGAGVTFHCYSYTDCSVSCQSLEYMLPDGHYTLDVLAPGFEPALVEFDIVNATNCGCCGCCPGSYYGQATLVPNGSELETCCADLMSDALNCGSCGVGCEAGASCVDGECQPSP